MISSGYCNRSFSIASIGFPNASRLRGRLLSSAATQSRSSSERFDRSLPLGKYCRSSPWVFSLTPRCRGECGSQKKIWMLASMTTLFHSRISTPWSQVSVVRNAFGRVLIFAVRIWRVFSAVYPSGRWTSIV